MILFLNGKFISKNDLDIKVINHGWSKHPELMPDKGDNVITKYRTMNKNYSLLLFKFLHENNLKLSIV